MSAFFPIVRIKSNLNLPARALVLAAIVASLSIPQTTPTLASVPSAPFEPASSGVRTVDSPEERAQLVQLLDRARSYYTLTEVHLPFHLKISFVVSSNGETKLDGNWALDETYSPNEGLRLTAETSGYSLQQLRAGKMLYQSPKGAIPLRLHEAVGHLMGPLESSPKAEHDLIRTIQGDVNGTPVTCVLLTNAQRSDEAAFPSRLWQEREECIDPKSGHLLFHSPAPGLAVVYDFTNTLHFHGKELPGKLTVIENGATVLAEQVETLEDVQNVDSTLFNPSTDMQSQGIALAGRVTFTLGVVTSATSPIQTVVVFGLLNPDGSITESHPLQSSDSKFVQAAVEKVSHLHYRVPAAPGANAEQHEFFAVFRFNPDQSVGSLNPEQ